MEPIEGAEFIVFASSLADLLRAGHWQQAMYMCRTKPLLVTLHANELKVVFEQIDAMINRQRMDRVQSLALMVVAAIVVALVVTRLTNLW